MKKYELTYIISPEFTGEEAEAVAKEIEAFIQSKEGAITKEEKPNARTLSYPIKKHASGFVAAIEFNAEPEALKEITDMASKNGKIVRHMVIIKKPAKQPTGRKARMASEATLAAETVTAAQEPVPAPVQQEVVQEEPAATEKPEPKKVELKDIEQKLDEILSE